MRESAVESTCRNWSQYSPFLPFGFRILEQKKALVTIPATEPFKKMSKCSIFLLTGILLGYMEKLSKHSINLAIRFLWTILPPLRASKGRDWRVRHERSRYTNGDSRIPSPQCLFQSRRPTCSSILHPSSCLLHIFAGRVL